MWCGVQVGFADGFSDVLRGKEGGRMGFSDLEEEKEEERNGRLCAGFRKQLTFRMGI